MSFQKSVDQVTRHSEKKKQRAYVHKYVVLDHVSEKEKIFSEWIQR